MSNPPGALGPACPEVTLHPETSRGSLHEYAGQHGRPPGPARPSCPRCRDLRPPPAHQVPAAFSRLRPPCPTVWLNLPVTPTVLPASPTVRLGEPTDFPATRTVLLATPTELLGAPTGLPATPTDDLASPTDLLAMPTELLGAPTDLLDAPEIRSDVTVFAQKRPKRPSGTPFSWAAASKPRLTSLPTRHWANTIEGRITDPAQSTRRNPAATWL